MNAPEQWFPFSMGPNAASIFIVAWATFFTLWKFARTSSKLQHQSSPGVSSISACKNPNCVRCRRYRHVQDRARAKIAWIVQDLKRTKPSISLDSRIEHGVQRGKADEDGNVHGYDPFQAPTVLMVPRLPTQEVVTSLHHQACQYLRQQPTRKIVMEALENLSDADWTTNDSHQGSWRVWHILNQGTWNPNLLLLRDSPPFQALLHLVRNIPGLLEKCLFGNVMISKIHPGTIIEPHCGPTNVRHRLQFLVELPVGPSDSATSSFSGDHHYQQPSLLVGKDVQVTWSNEDRVFVFDDSFVHSVNFRIDENSRNNLARTVLIVDLWHPSLDALETTLLQDLYPPLYSIHKN
jgi:Aspartyl/Asparaginyl beta-hydroxylase